MKMILWSSMNQMKSVVAKLILESNVRQNPSVEKERTFHCKIRFNTLGKQSANLSLHNIKIM